MLDTSAPEQSRKRRSTNDISPADRLLLLNAAAANANQPEAGLIVTGVNIRDDQEAQVAAIIIQGAYWTADGGLAITKEKA